MDRVCLFMTKMCLLLSKCYQLLFTCWFPTALSVRAPYLVDTCYLDCGECQHLGDNSLTLCWPVIAVRRVWSSTAAAEKVLSIPEWRWGNSGRMRLENLAWAHRLPHWPHLTHHMQIVRLILLRVDLCIPIRRQKRGGGNCFVIFSHPRTISTEPRDTEGDADSLPAQCILIRAFAVQVRQTVHLNYRSPQISGLKIN